MVFHRFFGADKIENQQILIMINLTIPLIHIGMIRKIAKVYPITDSIPPCRRFLKTEQANFGSAPKAALTALIKLLKNSFATAPLQAHGLY